MNPFELALVGVLIVVGVASLIVLVDALRGPNENR